jgi:hypothetical protein
MFKTMAAAKGTTTYNGPTIIKDFQNDVNGAYTNGAYSGPIKLGDDITEMAP